MPTYPRVDFPQENDGEDFEGVGLEGLFPGEEDPVKNAPALEVLEQIRLALRQPDPEDDPVTGQHEVAYKGRLL